MVVVQSDGFETIWGGLCVVLARRQNCVGGVGEWKTETRNVNAALSTSTNDE